MIEYEKTFSPSDDMEFIAVRYDGTKEYIDPVCKLTVTDTDISVESVLFAYDFKREDIKSFYLQEREE